MNGSQSLSYLFSESLGKKCVYCLRNNQLCEDQILMRGNALYLCAPRGQMIEGYLVIAPSTCVGCLSHLPGKWLPELTRLKSVVADFYREVYGITQGTFYEQGRAGGGAVRDAVGGFPHHAHLCCLPFSIDLHTLLEGKYDQRNLSGPDELSAVAQNNPYIYVESIHGEGSYKRRLYVAQSEDGRAELERKRLKPIVAAVMGLPERGDWRAYPGDRELGRVIQSFRDFQRRKEAVSWRIT
ncbi:MAG TPA: hypothetical protein VIS96_10105 [Terrimicrobiaceae bacterium]